MLYESHVWCLLNKGKSSNNSQTITKVYEELVAQYGDNPTEADTATFIEQHLKDQHIVIEKSIEQYQRDWDSIAEEFKQRAEKIFGVTLPQDVTAYLTINTRSPYSIQDHYFFVSFSAISARRTAMHELWHFYTWYGLGEGEEARMGKQEYNERKEALTVLLNVECKDLLPDGVIDNGYPQHKELREKILQLWEKEKDIKKLWSQLAK